MLQKLPGFGCGGQRRFGHCLFAPVPGATQRAGVALPGGRLAGRGAPALGRHCGRRAGLLCLLPVQVITAPSLRLDTATDRLRLSPTVQAQHPVLLVLDPLIRLHRVDENDATQIAALLSYLRELQRQFQLAVLLVHHARKDSQSSRPGQALRGSSELHGWGDSNLYLRRKGSQLTLSTEHRAAPSRDHIPLQLTQSGSALALTVLERPIAQPDTPPTPIEQVRQALAQLQEPSSVQQLQKLCGIRTANVCSALAELSAKGEVVRDARGYQLKLPFPVSRPMDPNGNGNGKHTLCSSGR